MIHHIRVPNNSQHLSILRRALGKGVHEHLARADIALVRHQALLEVSELDLANRLSSRGRSPGSHRALPLLHSRRAAGTVLA